MSSIPPPTHDWSAAQYLKFASERTRPVHDLLSCVVPHVHTPRPRIFDLGCGPGNSTRALIDAFPGALVTGVDSSPAMLTKARASLPGVDFVEADLASWTPLDGSADVLFSNATLHWLRHGARMATVARLFAALPPGGVLALQVPDNYDEPSHRAMREVATLEGRPWSRFFATTRVGDLEDAGRPDLDPIEPPEVFYGALGEGAASVDVWRTEYFHAVEGARAVVEWVKGSGLRPYLQRIEGDEERRAFLDEYERRLEGAYPEVGGGRVLLAYPRLFVVGVRK